MPIIKEKKIEEDSWLFIADDEALPEGRDVIVSLHRMKELGNNRKLPQSGRLGVVLENTENALELKKWLDQIDLVQLSFPAFTDGRAYSQSRILRTQLEYDGDIRATGDVLMDQAHSMERCGFSSFEISDTVSLEDWKRVTASLDYSYQRGYELRSTETRSRLLSNQIQIPTETTNVILHV